MSDLQPYTCTAEECSQPEKTYSTLKCYLRHEILSHEVQHSVAPVAEFVKKVNESITCLFCGQRTTEGRGKNSRGRHVGQHMEEVAFMVVPKAYEDWEFYSEASSGVQAGFRCEKINPFTGNPCNREYPISHNLTRHEILLHSSEKIRCQICTEEKTFWSMVALRRHMRVVHQTRPSPTVSDLGN